MKGQKRSATTLGLWARSSSYSHDPPQTVTPLVLRLPIGQGTEPSHLPGIAWPTNLLTGHRSEREDLREVTVWEVPAGCLGKWGQEPRNLGVLSDLSGILASP